MTWPIKNFQLLFVQAAVNQEPETGVEKPEVEVAAEKPEQVNKILTLIDMFSHVTFWLSGPVSSEASLRPVKLFRFPFTSKSFQ